jgi:membrane-bound lytic murein transglycosylase D
MKTTTISNVDNLESKGLKVKILKGNSPKKEYYFDHSFTIGRSEDCSIHIDENIVSRLHIEVIFDNGNWQIVDKGSRNGTFLNGEKVSSIEIKNSVSIELGKNGPIILFAFEGTEDSFKGSERSVSEDGSVTGYIKHYFDEPEGDREIGKHTRLMREAFKVVKKKNTKKYIKIIIGIIVIAIVATAYSIYQHIKVSELKEQAENYFYEMKEKELSLIRLIDSVNIGEEKARVLFKKIQEFEGKYNNLVKELGVYKEDETERLIQKTAREFGECEINMPDEFISEVKKYIHLWKTSARLRHAIKRAKENNYPQFVVYQLNKRGLPLQLFYLPLQESDYKEKSVGPKTYMGYAKGIWHFIAPTAKRYGLKIGPLKDTNEYDPDDERFNFFKATIAGTEYLKTVYGTDAQASGLLVVASYNWGENRVIRYINQLTKNPKERNFWKLLSNYGDKIPKQTHDYVFYIFSAAVIGENPKLFGFHFDNPIKRALQILND